MFFFTKFQKNKHKTNFKGNKYKEKEKIYIILEIALYIYIIERKNKTVMAEDILEILSRHSEQLPFSKNLISQNHYTSKQQNRNNEKGLSSNRYKNSQNGYEEMIKNNQQQKMENFKNKLLSVQSQEHLSNLSQASEIHSVKSSQRRVIIKNLKGKIVDKLTNEHRSTRDDNPFSSIYKQDFIEQAKNNEQALAPSLPLIYPFGSANANNKKLFKSNSQQQLLTNELSQE